MKKEYTAPVLEDLGSVAELTQGNAQGGFTDANFPQNTPFANLTFS